MTDTEKDALHRRRFVQTTAGTIGLAGGLAGCLDGGGGGDSTPTDESDGTSSLEVMHWWTAGGEADAIEALYEGFEQEYPDVDVDDNPAPGGAGNALDTQIRNRVVNENPPSTFQIWPGESLQPFYESDVLEDIGDIWSDEMRDAYLEGVKDAASPAGNFVAVPINIHRMDNVFYNVSVVEDAGLDPSTIDSPQALMDAVATVDEDTDAIGMAQSTSGAWTILQFFEMALLAELGPDSHMDFLDGNVADYETEIKDSLQFTADLREFYNEDASSVAWDDANGYVIDGEAAFLHNGDWAAGQYNAAEDFAYEDDWDYIQFPGTEDSYAIVMDSFVYPSNNPSPDATEAWLTYCGSRDAQIRFNSAKGSIPPRTDIDAEEMNDDFLASQMAAFDQSSAQPPTIAHGSAVNPDQKSQIESAFADFIESWDVDQTYQGIRDAF